jgi:Ca2+-binding EF-hand superfamily protein
MMRHKLTLLSNGNQEEFTLRNLYRSFDKNNNGTICLNELTGLLAKLKIAADNRTTVALFKRLDLNNSGTLEFEEFCKLVIEDPYK